MSTMKVLAILSSLIIGVALLTIRIAHDRQIKRLERKLYRLRGGIDQLKRRFDRPP
jgi:hypothetical protein